MTKSHLLPLPLTKNGESLDWILLYSPLRLMFSAPGSSPEPLAEK